MRGLRRIFAAAALACAQTANAQDTRAQQDHVAVTPDARSLSFYNTHTGENLGVVYKRAGVYDTAALRRISHLLRDHRTGKTAKINPRLLDALDDISRALVREKPSLKPVFHVISGYRSPESNAALKKSGAKVAEQSQHTRGNAIDFRIPGVKLKDLRDAAWCEKPGGVGYYPEAHNDFIHVDVSRVRFWPIAIPKWKCMK